MTGQLHLQRRRRPSHVFWLAIWLAVIATGILLVWLLMTTLQSHLSRQEFLAAAYRGDAATVRSLGLKDQQTLDEAFRKAAHDGNAETVTVLLARGANVNSRYARGETAIMVAGADGCHTSAECQAIWQVLLQHHPDLTLQDDVGQTALHYASLFGDEALVKELLKRKVTVDPRDRSGSTPLITAVRCGNLGAAKALREHGADPAISDRYGLSANRYFRGKVKAEVDAARNKRKRARGSAE